MRDRLMALGWSEIEIIDDDLGRSAAGGVPRAGFERMVAEVCLGKVGAVSAREVSRFARNSRDWQQLDVELLGKLSQGSIAFDGGKRHLRLEDRCVVPARSSLHGRC
jgi:hypothetical protein